MLCFQVASTAAAAALHEDIALFAMLFSLQVAHLVLNGGRPEIPAPQDLPGPDRCDPGVLHEYTLLIK
jgi:hypothetical protein